MGNIFAGSEIIEIGIQIEKNGRDFYHALVKKSKDPKAKEIFGFLAGEEEKHIAVFKDILEKTDKYEPQGLDADNYFAYMSTLAGEHIFTRENQGEEIAKKAASEKEAVNLGIGLEKDSIIFYEGMKKMVPEYDIRIIDEVIAQEQLHLKTLTELKAEI